MLKSKLEKLADVLMENETNPNIDKDIIVYGLYSAIEQSISVITAMILGFMFGLTIEVVIFMISYTFIRTYAGGYHCKKAVNCYLMSSGIIASVLGIIKVIPSEFILVAGVITLVISIPIIYKFAPMETPTKPLDEEERIHYRKKALFNLSVECLLVVVLFILDFNNFAFTICLGIVVTAVVLILQIVIVYIEMG